jgi:hypothetical protein
MPLYVVPRTRAWRTEEELAATADCLPSVAALHADLQWVRSYVVEEEDGTLSAFCVYEASGPEVVAAHSEAMRLPTDAIKRVTATLVAGPDPAPVTPV